MQRIIYRSRSGIIEGGKVKMRLDSLGKPPLLQVVSDPKDVKGGGKPSALSEIKQVTETPEQSAFANSRDQTRLGQILELFAKNKRGALNKKKVKWAVVQYQRAHTYNEKIKVGESLDVRG
jgi:hypothetical protein